MKLNVFGDRVVFKALPDDGVGEEKTVGGLYIPQTVRDNIKAQRRNYKGEDVMAGNKCEFVKEDSIVAYDQYGVSSFWHLGEELMIVREKDLIGLYE